MASCLACLHVCGGVCVGVCSIASCATGQGDGGVGDDPGGGNGDSGSDNAINPSDVDNTLDPDAACVTSTSRAQRIPLDMYFMLDTSMSMQTDKKLDALKAGLTGFLAAPSSSDLGVAGQHFPIGGVAASCESSVYGAPASGWEILAGQPGSHLAVFINGLTPDGLTPSVPALRGAVDACIARRDDQELHRSCAVVFVSDGQPEGNCEPTAQAAQIPLRNIAGEASANGILVFAVMFPNGDPYSQQIMRDIAIWGGTETVYKITDNEMASSFREAVEKAKGTALGCEYEMPQAEHGEVIEPNLVRVVHTNGSGTVYVIPRMMNQGECAGETGWYYDDNDLPTKLIMCPSTCTQMLLDNNGEVVLSYGCLNIIA